MSRVVRARVPTGFLGMLAVVLILDVGFFRLDRFATNQAESWRFKGRWARERAAGGEVLIFGDSILEFGLLPSVLRERTGLQPINLAIHNGSPAASYFLLRRALDSGAEPEAIVVDFMPHQLARDALHDSFERSWPELLTIREALDLAATTRAPEFFARTVTSQALACVAARHEVRASVLAALRGESASAREGVRLLRRNWEANRGAQVIPETTSRPPSRFDGLFPDRWECLETTEAYIRRFLALAESRRVPVYWVLPPIRPGAQEWRDRRGLDAPYLDFVAGLQADHGGLKVVDGRKSGYGDALFVDAVHLNRRGAESLSAAVADVLATSASSEKKIALAPFRDPGRGNRGVEDLEQSRAALRADPRPTRRVR